MLFGTIENVVRDYDRATAGLMNILDAILNAQDGANAAPAGGGDLLSMLTPTLDRDGDGSPMNDILATVGKMFGSR